MTFSRKTLSTPRVSTGLLVDETKDTLDTATASETTDGGLGDALDVITKCLAMTLGASLSKTFTSFSATRHDELLLVVGDVDDETRFMAPRRAGVRTTLCMYRLVNKSDLESKSKSAIFALPDL